MYIKSSGSESRKSKKVQIWLRNTAFRRFKLREASHRSKSEEAQICQIRTILYSMWMHGLVLYFYVLSVSHCTSIIFSLLVSTFVFGRYVSARAARLYVFLPVCTVRLCMPVRLSAVVTSLGTASLCGTSLCLSMSLGLYTSLCLSTSLGSACLYTSLPVFTSRQSLRLSACLYVSLAICTSLAVCMSLWAACM